MSSVDADGTLVETVFIASDGTTSFVRQSASGLERVATIDRDGRTCVPVRPGNDLLKHRALLFPSAPAPCGTGEQLLGEIEAYIAQYVSLSDDARKLSAAYVVLTWLYDAFREVPYLRFRGEYGTGKTRALIVVGSIAYKPFFASGASTVSPIFHTIDTFKGTLIFDEADFRFSDEKAELVKILNNGNVEGFPVLRSQVTPQKEFEPRAFHVFGPKIVAMRGHYDDRALESRFLSIDMEPSACGGAPINLPDAHGEDGLALRNQLLSFRLRERLSTRLYDSLAVPALEPRMNQILIPLLSVVPPGAYRDAILRHAERHQNRTVADRGDTVEGHVLGVIHGLAVEKDSTPVPLSAIATAFRDAYAGEYERPITNRYVGSVIRRLGLQPFKSHGTYVLAVAGNERLAALYRRFGIVDTVGTESGEVPS
ncbi:MAG: hypothetical protein U1E21_18390 [Reyranellaceae bacterium]